LPSVRAAILAGLATALSTCTNTSRERYTSLHCPEDSTLQISEHDSWCANSTGANVGAALAWHAPGHLQSVSQFVAGEVSASVQFHETGYLEAVRLAVPGTDREISHQWHPNGTPKIYSEWRGGKLDGRYESWLPSGKPDSQGHFAEGERVGTWRFWNNEDGSEKVIQYQLPITHSDRLSGPNP